MADLKFSCPRCGQHIACDEAWSGQQIPCPACQGNLVVPQAQRPVPAAVITPNPPAPGRPKLAADSTQTARPKPAGSVLPKRPMPPRSKIGNTLLGYTVLGILVVVVGGLGFAYLPGLISQVKELGTSPTTTSGGGGSGPMGDVSGAMDVSDALDGGSQSSPRAKPAAVRPAATSATNSLGRRASPGAK